MEEQIVSWDIGTGYDLFASLVVLHKPANFGLRASWAAGVRSRVSSGNRETLERAQAVIHIPLEWFYSLDGEKNAQKVIRALEKMPPEKRLQSLVHFHDQDESMRVILQNVAGRGTWNDADENVLRKTLQKFRRPVKQKTVRTILDIWASPAAFGEAYLEALQDYYRVFFMEEERHIRKSLSQALENARQLSKTMPLGTLVETLSHGVRYTEISRLARLVIIPSYWLSPLVVFEKISENMGMFLFGARPEHVSLVPGEVIPPNLLTVLKTLSDPTRLRILRYLKREKITPAELSRRLRLRAPTVTHHLNALRLAGLVSITLDEKHERHYQARLDAIETTFDVLMQFLGEDVKNDGHDERDS